MRAAALNTDYLTSIPMRCLYKTLRLNCNVQRSFTVSDDFCWTAARQMARPRASFGEEDRMDLKKAFAFAACMGIMLGAPAVATAKVSAAEAATLGGDRLTCNGAEKAGTTRSEEHTSELQSLMRISYAVFCLKKKKQKNTRQ